MPGLGAGTCRSAGIAAGREDPGRSRELRVIAEARYDGTTNRQPEISDYIDISSLGHSDRGQIREMAVTITADPQATLAVVASELVILSWLRHRFFSTSFARSFLVIAVGGAIIAALSSVLGIVAGG